MRKETVYKQVKTFPLKISYLLQLGSVRGNPRPFFGRRTSPSGRGDKGCNYSSGLEPQHALQRHRSHQTATEDRVH
jgi:hypothetical protein